MTREELFKLIDAGFSKEEILKLDDPAPATGAPDPTPAPDPKPQQAATTNDPDPVDRLQETLDNFITRLQQMNISLSQQPEAPAETTEDILSALLMPSYNKKKEG